MPAHRRRAAIVSGPYTSEVIKYQRGALLKSDTACTTLAPTLLRSSSPLEIAPRAPAK